MGIEIFIFSNFVVFFHFLVKEEEPDREVEDAQIKEEIEKEGKPFLNKDPVKEKVLVTPSDWLR